MAKRHSPVSVVVVRSGESPGRIARQEDSAERLDQRRALDEMSIRVWAISRDLGNSGTANAELCEDAHELEVT
jgi:hypothetical protein